MRIYGHLDYADRHHVAGWCKDDDDPDHPVSLVVTVDDAFVTRVLANAFRSDLATSGAGGHLSYRVDFEEALSPLTRHVVDVRGEIDGLPLAGSPIVIAPSKAFDTDMRLAISEAVAMLETEAEAEERLGFLADQIDGVLRAKERLRSGPNERRARRKALWRQGRTAQRDAPIEPRALVIDVGLPVSTRDAGSVAILSHLHSLQRLGYAVDFVPTNLEPHESAGALDDVNVLARPWYGSVEEVLASHRDAFDLVYLHRSSVAAFYAPLVRLHQPSARVIFSVADLGSIRLARQAVTEERPELVAQSRYEANLEQKAYEWCDVVITHSSAEATILRDTVRTEKVHLVPFSVVERESRVPFFARAGIAFIGGYEHAPNVDAAVWLAHDIMPAVAATNPSIQALLVGSSMPAHVRALGCASVFPLGAVEDLSIIFDRVRLTVAPLAYGAGVKGKVLDSLAAGVPCVCTPIAAEGLDLPDLLASLVASDADDIARLIVRLHDDEVFNAACAEAGRSYVAARASNDAVDAAMRAVAQS